MHIRRNGFVWVSNLWSLKLRLRVENIFGSNVVIQSRWLQFIDHTADPWIFKAIMRFQFCFEISNCRSCALNALLYCVQNELLRHLKRLKTEFTMSFIGCKQATLWWHVKCSYWSRTGSVIPASYQFVLVIVAVIVHVVDCCTRLYKSHHKRQLQPYNSTQNNATKCQWKKLEKRNAEN